MVGDANEELDECGSAHLVVGNALDRPRAKVTACQVRTVICFVKLSHRDVDPLQKVLVYRVVVKEWVSRRKPL